MEHNKLKHFEFLKIWLFIHVSACSLKYKGMIIWYKKGRNWNWNCQPHKGWRSWIVTQPRRILKNIMTMEIQHYHIHIIYILPSRIAIPRCTSSDSLEWTNAQDNRIMLSFFASSEESFSASVTSFSQPC